MQIRFKRLKEEVDSELRVVAGELVGLFEKVPENHPQWFEMIEDLLIIARECVEMSPDKLRKRCETVVQFLDDRRHELPSGNLKKIHNRMLFILTRCTRLLQYQNDSVLPNKTHDLMLHQLSDLGPGVQCLNLKKLEIKHTKILENHTLSSGEETPKSTDTPTSSRDRISSWKTLPSVVGKNIQKEGYEIESVASEAVGDSFAYEKKSKRHVERNHFDDFVDPSIVNVEESVMICRICDLKIPKLFVEEHSRICTIADRCDFKGLSINDRLEGIARILEKILQITSNNPISINPISTRIDQEEFSKVSVSSMTEEFDKNHEIACNQNISPNPFVIEAAPQLPDDINLSVLKEFSHLSPISCKTQFMSSADPVRVASSLECMTPHSQLSTPHTDHIAFSSLDDFEQIHDLLDIARCVKNVKSSGYSSVGYLHKCFEYLENVIQDKKGDALIVETFGRRIEKLLKEKCINILQEVGDGKESLSRTTADENGSMEMDISHNSRTSPGPSKLKDRTTIEDFEIIKPISRGAFGRVFLTRKRVTGDLFAIKVLKKADTIRKNAVESILAERDILISVRNPFVVRFFYSFTCSENLYLVMEYLNGGDLYSLLRNMGCLDEDMVRTYIAEIVLALEYLHSLHVIHRDIKPDNLLIAHNGHVKLTDFGLSKVGLIDSTDDLSGPDISGSGLLDDYALEASNVQRMQKRKERQKQTVVGTPDYLAPEILLGMQHGPTADWWSVGIVMFELLVGIPPFNADHPQKIFENIINRDIPWPLVPEEMSHEAYDLIDKLLLESPVQRLGATGSAEVKRHPFFKDINWDKLAEQKAAFVPSTEGDHDTSYFKSRHTWESCDGKATNNECDSMSDMGSTSCSSYGYEQDEDRDRCNNLQEFGTSTYAESYSFSNFSFKNLSQLASMNCEMVNKDSNDDSNHPPLSPPFT